MLAVPEFGSVPRRCQRSAPVVARTFETTRSEKEKEEGEIGAAFFCLLSKLVRAMVLRPAGSTGPRRRPGVVPEIVVVALLAAAAVTVSGFKDVSPGPASLMLRHPDVPLGLSQSSVSGDDVGASSGASIFAAEWPGASPTCVLTQSACGETLDNPVVACSGVSTTRALTSRTLSLQDGTFLSFDLFAGPLGTCAGAASGELVVEYNSSGTTVVAELYLQRYQAWGHVHLPLPTGVPGESGTLTIRQVGASASTDEWMIDNVQVTNGRNVDYDSIGASSGRAILFHDSFPVSGASWELPNPLLWVNNGEQVVVDSHCSSPSSALEFGAYIGPEDRFAESVTFDMSHGGSISYVFADTGCMPEQGLDTALVIGLVGAPASNGTTLRPLEQVAAVVEFPPRLYLDTYHDIGNFAPVPGSVHVPAAVASSLGTAAAIYAYQDVFGPNTMSNPDPAELHEVTVQNFTPTCGEAGLAFTFPGSATLTATPATALSLAVNSTWTVEWWMKVKDDTVITTSPVALVDANGWRIGIDATNHVVLAADTSTGSVSLTHGRAIPLDNAWHHYAVVWSSQGTVRFVFDGAADTAQYAGPADIGTVIQPPNAQLVIGQLFHGGVLDEFRLWGADRTDEEIARDRLHRIDADSLLLYTDAPLIAYYPMDTTESSVPDRSGNGNDAVYAGMPPGSSSVVLSSAPLTPHLLIPDDASGTGVLRLAADDLDSETATVVFTTIPSAGALYTTVDNEGMLRDQAIKQGDQYPLPLYIVYEANANNNGVDVCTVGISDGTSTATVALRVDIPSLVKPDEDTPPGIDWQLLAANIAFTVVLVSMLTYAVVHARRQSRADDSKALVNGSRSTDGKSATTAGSSDYTVSLSGLGDAEAQGKGARGGVNAAVQRTENLFRSMITAEDLIVVNATLQAVPIAETERAAHDFVLIFDDAGRFDSLVNAIVAPRYMTLRKKMVLTAASAYHRTTRDVTALDSFAMLHCLSYAVDALQEATLTLLEEDMSLASVRQFFTKAFASHVFCPSPVRSVARTLKAVVAAELPDAWHAMPGGFMLLRVLCLPLQQVKDSGLMEREPTPVEVEYFAVLQDIMHALVYDEPPASRTHTALTEELRPGYRAFVEAIVSDSVAPPTTYLVSKDELQEATKRVHAFFVLHLDRVMRKVSAAMIQHKARYADAPRVKYDIAFRKVVDELRLVTGYNESNVRLVRLPSLRQLARTKTPPALPVHPLRDDRSTTTALPQAPVPKQRSSARAAVAAAAASTGSRAAASTGSRGSNHSAKLAATRAARPRDGEARPGGRAPSPVVGEHLSAAQPEESEPRRSGSRRRRRRGDGGSSGSGRAGSRGSRGSRSRRGHRTHTDH